MTYKKIIEDDEFLRKAYKRHQWKASYMAAEIVSFWLSLEDKYFEVSNNAMTFYHRGTWYNHDMPGGYFSKLKISLTDTQKKQIKAILESINFSRWQTSPRAFLAAYTPGGVIEGEFECNFSNSEDVFCFSYSVDVPPDFENLFSVLWEVVQRDSKFTDIMRVDPQNREVEWKSPHQKLIESFK